MVPPSRLAPLLLVLACTTSDGDTNASGPASTGGPTSPTSSTSGDASEATPTSGQPGGGPVVTELLTTVDQLTEGGSIIFTAIVNDPDGLDTILGGKLLSDDESAFYGPFMLSGGGTYQIALTWDLIHQTAPIDFIGSSEIRVFRADFQDTDGNHGAATLELILSCTKGAACDGVCTRIDDNDNCGQCGNMCDAGTGGLGCVQGECG